MLNPFPILLSFSIFAPFILRLAIGSFFIKKGWVHLRINRHTGEEIAKTEGFLRDGQYLIWGIAGFEVIAGLALFIGIFTQVASLILLLILISGLVFKNKKWDFLVDDRNLSYVLIAICLSLLFTGAGWPAIDLPL